MSNAAPPKRRTSEWKAVAIVGDLRKAVTNSQILSSARRASVAKKSTIDFYKPSTRKRQFTGVFKASDLGHVMRWQRTKLTLILAAVVCFFAVDAALLLFYFLH